MKLKEQLILRQVGNSYFIVDAGKKEVDLTNIYALNKEAAFLWEAFHGKEFTMESMVECLCSRYDVPRDTAEHDVNEMLNTWQQFGLME